MSEYPMNKVTLYYLTTMIIGIKGHFTIPFRLFKYFL